MVNAMNAAHHGQGGRHRGLPRIADGVQRTDQARAGQGHSRCSATTPTPRTTGSRTSARISICPATPWARGSSTSSVRATVALFIATPGQLNIQPRIDGAIAAIKKFGKGKIKTTATATGALLPDELAKIDAYYLGHKDLKGMFAVDYGSTEGVGKVMQKYGLAEEGRQGRRLRPRAAVLKPIQAGHLDFTIDQQPYLQGWLPVLQLFFYKYSSGLVAPSDTNTGILFVTKANVKPYLSTKTRYDGSSSKQKYPVTQPG